MVTSFNFWFYFKDCFFGAVKLAKNANSDKYVYSGYGIGFGSRSEFSLTDCSVGKNVIIFGAASSSSVNIDNKGRYHNSWQSSNTKIRWYHVNGSSIFS